MHAYFRNHQLYLAERCNWLDRQVIKSSKRALMKIESWKLIAQTEENDFQVKLIEKLVKDSLPDLVHASLDLLVDEEKGIWHLANQGAITWAELATETADRFGMDPSMVHAVPLKDLSYPAMRPQYCVLGSEKGHLLPTLEHALGRFFHEKKAHDVTVMD